MLLKEKLLGMLVSRKIYKLKQLLIEEFYFATDMDLGWVHFQFLCVGASPKK